MTPPVDRRLLGGALLANVALAGVYFGTAKLGLSLAFQTTSVTAVWPPTGIALVAVLLGGRRLLPGIFAGALLANATTGGLPPAAVTAIAAGNALEALVGAWLLRRSRFDAALERVRDVIALAVLAGAVSTTVAATIGTTALLAADEIARAGYGEVWRTWWLGDMGGALLVAPALFVALRWRRRRELPGGAGEAAVLMIGLGALSALVFSVEAPILYLVIPGLVWGALRFWQPGAAAASLIVASVAVALTDANRGPFMRSDADESLLLAQTFVGFAGVTAYLLAAAATERRRVEDVVQGIADTLQQSLLPRALPHIPGVEIATHFVPAGLRAQVGGDFYDVFPSGPGAWTLTIGDVCGKGARAASVTGLARHTLRAAARFEDGPSALLALLNDAVRSELLPEEFCTASCVRLTPHASGGVRLTVANGGHPLPLVVRADGAVERAGEPGMLLGAVEQPLLRDDTLELAAGDLLVAYTDGLTEAGAPEHVTTEAELEAFLATQGGRSAQQVADSLVRGFLDGGHSEPRDDVALVVLRVER
jgi:serine phosphatase RsbU (regulator of sigma subunit)